MKDELVVEELLTASRAFVAVALRTVDTARPKVTVLQHRVLVLLAARGAQFIGALAAELNINSSNATRHCDRLERKGLIERSKTENDGRTVLVSLTAHGRLVIDQVSATRRIELQSLVSAMRLEDRERLALALRGFNIAASEIPDRDWNST
ncbi:MAG: ywhA-like uncharacterized HTH-type transcriptional regulator [Marmoricola sp.]|nr:ywhA-like uncharacterized HTH-type transcriptional regulator [Marmoricola sp.]